MSAELLDALKQKAAELTAQERSQLADYLLAEAKRTAQPQPPINKEAKEAARQRRAEWFKAHREEYAGQYVALDGDRLLGTGKSYAEAARAARLAGVSDAYVDYVHPPGAIAYMGGW